MERKQFHHGWDLIHLCCHNASHQNNIAKFNNDQIYELIELIDTQLLINMHDNIAPHSPQQTTREINKRKLNHKTKDESDGSFCQYGQPDSRYEGSSCLQKSAFVPFVHHLVPLCHTCIVAADHIRRLKEPTLPHPAFEGANSSVPSCLCLCVGGQRLPYSRKISIGQKNQRCG